MYVQYRYRYRYRHITLTVPYFDINLLNLFLTVPYGTVRYDTSTVAVPVVPYANSLICMCKAHYSTHHTNFILTQTYRTVLTPKLKIYIENIFIPLLSSININGILFYVYYRINETFWDWDHKFYLSLNTNT